MRHTALIGLTIAAALLAAPLASAQTFHKTYEVGPTYAAWTCPTGFVTGQVGEPNCDPTGTTQDGSFDIGGAIFGPDDVDPDATVVTASVVDDIFGPGTVAGYGCTDENENNVCGETDQGETQVRFCGDSPPIEVGPPTDWQAVVIFVSYPVWMVTESCDAFGTTGGTLDPAGGIYATFG